MHQVNDRAGLFAELFRVLKPGAPFYFREPLDDFILWRLARDVVYRLSPTLDADTERPLRRGPTVADLSRAGFAVQTWRPLGFIGCCFLMNSDVLVFNRLFRFMPGIRPFTRWMTQLDDAALRLPGLRHAGVAVVGVAVKP